MRRQTKQDSRKTSTQVLERICSAIKAGKIKNLIKSVGQHGFEILDQSQKPNGDRAWEMAIKKGHFSLIMMALYHKGLITKDGATQLVKTYLFDRAKIANDRQLSEDSNNVNMALCQLNEHDDFKEIVSAAMVDIAMHSSIAEEVMFSHVEQNDVYKVDHCLSHYPHMTTAINEYGNLAHNAAVNRKSSGMIPVLKKHGVDLNYIHENRTPVFNAVRHANYGVLKELITSNADFGYVGDNITAVEYALHYVTVAPDNVQSQYIQCLNLLKKSGCKPNYSHFMAWLIGRNHLDSIKNLNCLRDITGDDIDLGRLVLRRLVLRTDNCNMSVVQCAANLNNLEALKIFIEQYKLEFNTALVIALDHENLPMAEYLLSCGADLSMEFPGTSIPIICSIFQRPSSIRLPLIKQILQLPLSNRKSLLNTPTPMIGFKCGSDELLSFSKQWTLIKMAIVNGEEDVADLLLQDSDVDICVWPSLYYIACIVERYEMIPLLQRHQVPYDGKTMNDLSYLPQEVRRRFTEYYKTPEQYPLLLQGDFETLYEDYQRLLGYYLIIKDIDKTVAAQISTYVTQFFEDFSKEHNDDYFALADLMYFLYPEMPTELRLGIETFRLCLSGQWLFNLEDKVLDIMREEVKGAFFGCFQSVKELFALPQEEPSTGKSIPVNVQAPSEYNVFPSAERTITAIKFLREEHGFNLEAAKKMIAETRKPKDTCSPHGASFWQAQPDSSAPEVKPSWLNGLLNSDDDRVNQIENNNFFYILLTAEIDLSGPSTESLLKKSRWKFAPTNAIHGLHGKFHVDLLINKQLLQTTFTHEICATSTADRILCCAIADEETGHRLLVPCHYCVGGIHHNTVDLPNKIEFNLVPMKCVEKILEKTELPSP